MKSKSFVMVFFPATVVMIGSGLMVMDGVVSNIIPAWLLWQLVLLAAITVCVAVAVMCVIWFVQWCMWLIMQRLERTEKRTADVLQYSPKNSEPIQPVKVERPLTAAASQGE